MKRNQLIAGVILALSSLGLTSSSFAVPVMDLRSEDLLQWVMGQKEALQLTPNQQILWQQLEVKTRAMLSDKRSRRERLQANLLRSLDNPAIELRDLAGTLDAESLASEQEGKRLREMWLTLNDALNDNQRQIVRSLLVDQLQRVADTGHDSSSSKPKQGGGSGRGKGMGGTQGAGSNF